MCPVQKCQWVALASVAQWVERWPVNRKVSSSIPGVRAHAWVEGQVPGWGRMKGNRSIFLLHINVSLPSPSLSPSFPLSLEMNE